jgi:hypothetical protein
MYFTASSTILDLSACTSFRVKSIWTLKRGKKNKNKTHNFHAKSKLNSYNFCTLRFFPSVGGRSNNNPIIQCYKNISFLSFTIRCVKQPINFFW